MSAGFSISFGFPGVGEYPQKPEVVEESGDPLCPYCGILLKKRPQRKTKCPSCKQFIYVKHTPVEPIRRLVTEGRAKEIEALWTARAEAQEQAQRDVEAARYGLPPCLSAEDLSAALIRFANDIGHELSDRRQAMVSAFYLIRSNASPALRRGFGEKICRLDLERLAENRYRTVAVRGGRDPCPSCERLVGKEYVLAERLAGDPVPNRRCCHWKEFGHCCAFFAMPKTFNGFDEDDEE